MLWSAYEGLEALQNGHGADEARYLDPRRSLGIALAVGGWRERLPKTYSLTKRPFDSSPAGHQALVAAIQEARVEISDVVEYESNRAYAEFVLGE